MRVRACVNVRACAGVCETLRLQRLHLKLLPSNNNKLLYPLPQIASHYYSICTFEPMSTFNKDI